MSLRDAFMVYFLSPMANIAEWSYATIRRICQFVALLSCERLKINLTLTSALVWGKIEGVRWQRNPVTSVMLIL